MHVPKPSDADKELFRSVIPDAPGVEVKPMFGNLGAFVNGTMFAGLLGAAIGVRIPDEATRDLLRAIEGTAPFGPDGRPMGGYVALPAAWATEPTLISHWIDEALAQVRLLPPKAVKTRRTR